MENKICVYAIAKNEEQNVELWYESMREANHVIVLDTGSTDNTVAKLRELGVEVHETQYEVFHFNEARNDSLKLVPDEYNIRVCTDLDERFEPGWATILREEWDQSIHQRAEYAYSWDHLDDGSVGHVFTYNKIHTYGWHGKDVVHETLCREEDDTREYTIEQCLNLTEKILLHHYQDLERNREWYVTLCEQRILEHPDDPLSYMELGREYLSKRRFQECVDFHKDTIENHRDLFQEIDVASMYHQMGLAYMMLNDGPGAGASFMNGIAIDPTYRDNYLTFIDLAIQNRMLDLALGVGKQAEKITFPQGHWTESKQSVAGGLDYSLSYIYLCQQEYEQAMVYILRALAKEPTNQQLVNLYTTIYNKLILNIDPFTQENVEKEE